MPDLATPTRVAPALAIDGLTYTYPNAPQPALRDISLHLAPGELALLAGRSACGKSTLLRAACGLVPHFHGGEINGQIEVAGMDAIASGPGELAAAVGYVAQDPETQVVSTTVAAEIELPLELRGDPPTSRARAVEEVALALAIPHLLDRAVDTLSGGELQRVALAAALVTRPKLVLLDEPTSQLDPVAGDELIWLLRRLNEEWGVTILLAEHRLERCLAAGDRVIAMAAGSIAFDGPPGNFLAWAQRTDEALETPAAKLFSLAGIEPLPVGVRDARRTLTQAPAATHLGRVASGWGDLAGPGGCGGQGLIPSGDPIPAPGAA
ncbi:MAG TPA: ABC transporter ATP-binding protein, partial [Solirubrobacterales bacterium]|nr:ABC transporter ATP-binding protein [Solirubrobacterales bacterium]